MQTKKIITFLMITIFWTKIFSQEYIQKADLEPIQSQEQSVYVPYSEIEIEREALMAAENAGHVSEQDATMTSSSIINWTKRIFTSDISFDVEKANIPMPSGKSTSIKEIEMKLPILIKNPLLSIYVDDSKTLGDLVLDGTLTLENLTRIIDTSKKTPAVFTSQGNVILTKHTLNLADISSTLVKHKTPYKSNRPIDRISSKKYTGIVIDARGTLPVQGEFIESEVFPCLFPRIWTENMDLLYERNMVQPEIVKTQGIVHYSGSEIIENYSDRVGKSPLWITAKKVYGINRTDPIISYDDYLRITSIEENMDLLEKGKVVVLLNKDQLEKRVSVPKKDKNYFINYYQLRKYFFERKIPDVELNEVLTGIQITMQNLRFIADSYELLPQEKPRIAEIAESLKKVTASGDYTILIEGHTADVNKPNGQMTLSIQRAQEIIKELSANGINKNLFSYRGFGGTKPVADNETPEGRAQNRRVEIIIMPKGSYILTE